jgi:hypothetical protein
MNLLQDLFTNSNQRMAEVTFVEMKCKQTYTVTGTLTDGVVHGKTATLTNITTVTRDFCAGDYVWFGRGFEILGKILDYEVGRNALVVDKFNNKYSLEPRDMDLARPTPESVAAFEQCIKIAWPKNIKQKNLLF